MALLTPHPRGLANSSNFPVGPTTGWGTTLNGSATPHALPASPTTVIAATEHPAEWMRVTVHSTFVSAALTDALLNIYIGGAGAETLLVDSLTAGWSSTTAQGSPPRAYWLPVRIPKGTRISASIRALAASETAQVMVELGTSNGAHWVGSGVETLGGNTAASRGTLVDPGSTGAMGSWYSLGTTTRPYRYVILGCQGNEDTTIAGGWESFQISADNSTALQELLFAEAVSGSEFFAQFTDLGRWCDIPSGTTLYVRGSHHSAGNTSQYLTIHGVY